MINSNSSMVFKKTIIATVISTLCFSSAFAAAATQGATAATQNKAGKDIPASPFAYVPLHLQQTSVTTTGNKPKPNVMLFVDDSGSMNGYSGFDYRTRMDVTKSVLGKVVDEFGDQFNWGLHSLWTRNGKNSFMNADTAKEELQKIYAPVHYPNYTPAVKEYVDALTQTMNELKYRCQKSYVVMMSDGDAYNGSYDFIYPKFGQPEKEEFHGFESYFDKYEYEDDGKTLRFEFPWMRQRWSWKPQLHSGRRFTQTEISKNSYTRARDEEYRKASSSLGGGMSFYSYIAGHFDFKTKKHGKDAEGIGWDEDANYKDQTVKTYTIGFGNGISQYGTQFLQHGAQPDKNNHYMATSEEDLLKGLRSALNDAKSEIDNNAGKSTISVSTPASTGSNIPELSAYLTLDTINWSSMLVFNKYEADGITIKKDEKQYPLFPQKRVVMIHDGENTRELSDFSKDTKGLEFFGIKDENELQFGLIPWLSRNSADTDDRIESEVASRVKVKDRTVQKYRRRVDDARKMGDVMGSPIVALARNEATGRDGYLVTAANDGMLYIFKDTPDDPKHPFKLVANFIPGAISREDASGNDTIAKALKATAEEGYGQSSQQPHLFLNNGGIVYRTTPETVTPATKVGEEPIKAGKQTFIVGTTGQGGRGAYALNIGGVNRISKDPIAFDAYAKNGDEKALLQAPLWVTKNDTTDNTLGYTVGTPQIGQVARDWKDGKPNIKENVRLYAFMGNGYPIKNTLSPNAPKLDDVPTLYVYEALGQEMGTKGPKITGEQKGTLIAKLRVPASTDRRSSSLASPTLVDIDFDGIVDVAYAGDYDGNLYRFDLRENVEKWGEAKLIYRGITVKSKKFNIEEYTQHITAAPAVYRINKDNYVVIFGTGSDLYQSDLNDRNQQSLIGIYDNLTELNPEPKSREDLLKQTIINGTSKDNRRYVTNNLLEAKHKGKGWVLDLPAGTGERIVVKPELITSSVFFTTRNYFASQSIKGNNSAANNKYSCSTVTKVTKTSGESWLMGVNALTGGTFNLEKDAFFENDVRKKASGDGYESAAGIKLDGISSSVAIHSRSRKSYDATTVNGDAGGSGLGTPLSDKPATDKENAERNDCVPVDDYVAQVLDEGSAGVKSFKVSAKLCSEIGMYRLNQRDIPL